MDNIWEILEDLLHFLKMYQSKRRSMHGWKTLQKLWFDYLEKRGQVEYIMFFSFSFSILRGYAVASSSDDRMNEPPTSLGLVPHQVRHIDTQ